MFTGVFSKTGDGDRRYINKIKIILREMVISLYISAPLHIPEDSVAQW